MERLNEKRKKRVFLIDDDELILLTLSRALEEEYELRTDTAAEAGIVKKIIAWMPDAVLLDIKLPGQSGIDILRELRERGARSEVIMLTSDDTAETAVRAMKLGAADYLTKPFNIDEVKIVIRNVIEKKKLEQEVHCLRKISDELFERDLIGTSGAMQELKAKVEKIARARVSSILITGESGTGKEVFARYIHHLMYDHPGAQREPFVAINCAALPEHLLESELFGHEKGAFTDAKTEKKGIFEMASGGTILLDEIGDMRPDLQAKLLRVLEERTVRRIGGKLDIPVEVTVIATTNKDLNEAVRDGRFRPDLFFRLSTFYLHIPALRLRREDIPVLASHFLSLYARRYNNKTVKRFSPEAIALLTTYDWPGNVRELKNLIERLVVLESAEEILPKHLPHWLAGRGLAAEHPPDRRFILPDEGISLDDLERDLILQALDKAKHNKTLAARLLGISYDSFRYQIKKIGLE